MKAIDNKLKDKIHGQLDGFLISQVCVVDKNTFIIVANWAPKDKKKLPPSGTTTPTRLLSVDIAAKRAYGSQSANGVGRCYADGGYINGNKQALVGDPNGGINFFSYDAEDSRGTEPDDLLHNVLHVKLIGEHFYVASFTREIYKRISAGKWEMISETPYKLSRSNNSTLAIDGFSETDMYFSGEGGDLWHFNGTEWKFMDPPCDWPMAYLICAKDGKVYIGGRQGQLMIGRDTEWEEIIGSKVAYKKYHEIHSMAEFKNRIYMCDGIYVKHYNETTKTWEVSEDRFWGYRPGAIDANDDVMIIASDNEVYLYDGESYVILYDDSGSDTAKIAMSSLLQITSDIEEDGNHLIDLLNQEKNK